MKSDLLDRAVNWMDGEFSIKRSLTELSILLQSKSDSIAETKDSRLINRGGVSSRSMFGYVSFDQDRSKSSQDPKKGPMKAPTRGIGTVGAAVRVMIAL